MELCFRLKHVEGKYAAAKGQMVRNAAEFAVEKTSSRAKELLEASLSEPSCVTEEALLAFQRATAESFRSVGAREIQAAMAAAIRDATERVCAAAEELDVPGDAVR